MNKGLSPAMREILLLEYELPKEDDPKKREEMRKRLERLEAEERTRVK